MKLLSFVKICLIFFIILDLHHRIFIDLSLHFQFVDSFNVFQFAFDIVVCVCMWAASITIFIVFAVPSECDISFFCNE